MTLIYRNTPYGTVTIRDSDPQNIKDMWAEALKGFEPDPPPFIPTFRKAQGTDGVISWGLNQNYFATQETAEYIAKKYGDGKVYERPFGGSGGIFVADAHEFTIKLRDGREINAGMLAGYYDRNPEDKFPGVADKLIRIALGLA